MLKQLTSSVFLALIVLASSATQSSASVLLEWNGQSGSNYCKLKTMSRAGLGEGFYLAGGHSSDQYGCSWSEATDPVDEDWETSTRSIYFGAPNGPISAIANNGTVVAQHWLEQSVLVGAGGTYFTLPELFTETLADYPGASWVYKPKSTLAISAEGDVVVGEARLDVEYSCGANGMCSYVQTEAREAFLWTADGGIRGLGYLQGGNTLNGSGAVSISADGTVVVGWSSSANGAQAFRWTEDGGMVGLGDLAGGDPLGSAKGVSADGATIVGYSKSASGTEAFRWTHATGMVGLGDLPGGDFYSEAVAVSANGVLVVGNSRSRCVSGSCTTSTADYMPFHYRPFIWIYGIGMIAMEDYLALQGIDLMGWELYTVIGISDDGQTIVGYGKHGTTYNYWIASRVEEAQPSDILNPLSSSEPAERLLPGDAYAEGGEAANTGSSDELTAPLSVENPVVLPPADTTLSSDVSPQPSVADSVVLTIVGIGEEPPVVEPPPPPVEEPVVKTNGKRPRKVHAKPARATRKKSRK